ncbi:polyprenyl synthetase family protein [Candidatus Uabimicrobium amorphum]|uniref:Heptaprenyl diphosphate synthase subunit II n=1 Tax=Uabimicrobium amorphum TaxID=2596890 RepID=A0A5S9IPM8_UABAM|nr:polyprenyl synthetase family protein [Candidatus Uabimicrobium amorphum]BBM85306.1 heptaprenyl diphosphate synthase subunit II [Candidatus Uabimicrobium amorphum]
MANIKLQTVNQSLQLHEYAKKTLPTFHKEIYKFICETTNYDFLRNAAVYSLGIGSANAAQQGKRIRPILGLLLGEKMGVAPSTLMPFAIANEIFHSFLLIHDDIENNDEIRRNRPAVWVKYGKAHGINIGDYLYSKSFEALLQLENKVSAPTLIKLMKLFNTVSLYTGEGQAMDLDAEQAHTINLKTYIDIVLKKTGYYMSLPIVGSAILAQESKDTQDKLAEFGKSVGIAFQIIDDIVDVFEEKGRPIGSDIRSGSKSIIVIYTLKNCTNFERKKLVNILQKKREETLDSEINWSIKLFHKHKAIEFAKDLARQKIKSAQKFCGQVPKTLQDPLQQVTTYMLNKLHKI